MENVFCISNKINMNDRNRKLLNILERCQKGEWSQLVYLINLKAAPSSSHLLNRFPCCISFMFVRLYLL